MIFRYQPTYPSSKSTCDTDVNTFFSFKTSHTTSLFLLYSFLSVSSFISHLSFSFFDFFSCHFLDIHLRLQREPINFNSSIRYQPSWEFDLFFLTRYTENSRYSYEIAIKNTLSIGRPSLLPKSRSQGHTNDPINSKGAFFTSQNTKYNIKWIDYNSKLAPPPTSNDASKVWRTSQQKIFSNFEKFENTAWRG